MSFIYLNNGTIVNTDQVVAIRRKIVGDDSTNWEAHLSSGNVEVLDGEDFEALTYVTKAFRLPPMNGADNE